MILHWIKSVNGLANAKKGTFKGCSNVSRVFSIIFWPSFNSSGALPRLGARGKLPPLPPLPSSRRPWFFMSFLSAYAWMASACWLYHSFCIWRSSAWTVLFAEANASFFGVEDGSFRSARWNQCFSSSREWMRLLFSSNQSWCLRTVGPMVSKAEA